MPHGLSPVLWCDMSEAATQGSTRHKRSGKLKIPRYIGDAAGILSFCIFVFAGVGAVWGFLRPAVEVTVAEDAQVGLSSEVGAGASFTSFITFALITGILAMIAAGVVYSRYPAYQGVSMLSWLILVAGISSFAFWVVGDFTAQLMHPPAVMDDLSVGDTVTFVPPLAPHVGLLAGPFMAAFTYWVANLLDYLVPPAKLDSYEEAS